jgi:hypothetical protein
MLGTFYEMTFLAPPSGRLYFFRFTLLLTGYDNYTFLTGCEPDMCHTLMIHLQGPVMILAN